MSSEEIERIIREAYGKVPYAVGLNNHMGSAMTSNLFGMQKVMQAPSATISIFSTASPSATPSHARRAGYRREGD